MKNLITFLLVISSIGASSQNFAGFIEYLNGLPEDQRQAKVDSFMLATTSFPYTEDTLAHFIYSGPGSSLAVPGDFSAWNPSNAFMTNIGGTDFWFKTYVFENNARMDYKFVYDGSQWILDPNNPYTIPGGYGNNSELRMPMYVAPIEIEWDPSIPHGVVEDTSFYSSNLQNTRTVKVYLPADYDQSTDDYNLVLVHDGQDYISFAKMKNIMDYLHANYLITPTVAVFVPPVDRNPEYIDEKQDAFTSFIIEELMPWITGKYLISEEPEHHSTLGSSAGGNIALWIGMKHPEVFGHASAFSPYVEPDILNYLAGSGAIDLKLYILHGKYDHIDVIHQSVEALLPILEAQEYDFLYEEYPQGHSYGFWRGFVDHALIHFAPGSGFGINETNSQIEFDLFPNPCEDVLRVRYRIPDARCQMIGLYGIDGRKIRRILNEKVQPGEHEVVMDVSDLQNGIYMVRLQVGTEIAVQKLIVY